MTELVLDLNNVAFFVHVVRSGSFAAAGRKLGIPANTLSRRLQSLEEALGTRLLMRSTRKLNLTTAGNAFFAQCVEGIADIEQAGQQLLEATTEPSGNVRITTPADFFDHFPLAWIMEFMALYPKVQLTFLLDDRQVDLIEESIDIAFRSGKLEGATLVARKLADNTRGLFASLDFLARHGTPASIAALANFDCITAPSPTAKQTWVLHSRTDEVEVDVGGRFKANTAQAQLQAARAGLGVALLPINTTRRDVVEGRLIRILPEYQRDVGGVYAVSPSRRLRAPAVSALIEFIAQKLRVFQSD